MPDLKDSKDVAKMLDEYKQTVEDYRILFSSEIGQRVLDDLKKSFDGSTFHAEANSSFFLQGQREVYLKIKYLIEQAEFIKMEKEKGVETE